LTKLEIRFIILPRNKETKKRRFFMESNILEMNKTISISSKNQITIPKKVMEYLGFTKEAKIKVSKGSLIVTPVKENEDMEFSDLILEDLIKEGYSGEELLKEFKVRKNNVKPAIQELISDTEKNGVSYEDVFGED